MVIGNFKTLLFTLTVAVCCGLGVGVQPQTGRVAGLVVDVNDARIVGARITLENAEVKRTRRSDDEGRFDVEVPAGTYQITVEQPGFKKFQLPEFRVGTDVSELNVRMEVAPPMLPRKLY